MSTLDRDINLHPMPTSQAVNASHPNNPGLHNVTAWGYLALIFVICLPTALIVYLTTACCIARASKAPRPKPSSVTKQNLLICESGSSARYSSDEQKQGRRVRFKWVNFISGSRSKEPANSKYQAHLRCSQGAICAPSSSSAFPLSVKSDPTIWSLPSYDDKTRRPQTPEKKPNGSPLLDFTPPRKWFRITNSDSSGPATPTIPLSTPTYSLRSPPPAYPSPTMDHNGFENIPLSDDMIYDDTLNADEGHLPLPPCLYSPPRTHEPLSPPWFSGSPRAAKSTYGRDCGGTATQCTMNQVWNNPKLSPVGGVMQGMACR